MPANTLRLRLRVSPRSVAAGARRRYRFRATFRDAGRDRPVAGARIRFAGRTVRTGQNGRAKVTVRLGRGRHTARGSKRGLKAGKTTVRVRAR